MSFLKRKPVLGVSNHVGHRLGCVGGKRLENFNKEIEIILSRQRKTKALIFFKGRKIRFFSCCARLILLLKLENLFVRKLEFEQFKIV